MIRKIIVAMVLGAVMLVPASLFAEEALNPDEKAVCLQDTELKECPIRAERAKQRLSEGRDEEKAPGLKGGERPLRGNPQGRGPAMRGMGMREGIRAMGPQAMGEKFDAWMKNLTKAYQSNDREEMGRLLKEMKQTRGQMKRMREESGPQRLGADRGEGKMARERRGEGLESNRPVRGGEERGFRERRGQGRETDKFDGDRGHRDKFREKGFREDSNMKREFRGKGRRERQGQGEFRPGKGRRGASRNEFRCRCENCPMRSNVPGCPMMKNRDRQFRGDRGGYQMRDRDRSMDRRGRKAFDD